MPASLNRLREDVEEIVRGAPGRLGVSIRLVGHGQVVGVEPDTKFPLASVYKVPLLATLFHQVQSGKTSLDKRIVLREIDKSLGSSDLQYFRPGANLTVHDICYLMIVHSDNTATDLVHRLIGLEAPNEYMHELGLTSVDITCPNREYFLIFLGWSSRFKGMSLGEIARAWKKLPRDEIPGIYEEVRRETRSRTSEEARKFATKLWGIADEKETKEMRDASAAMENFASPRDIALLHELIVTRKIASATLTDQMIEYMLLCDARESIPAKIPPNVLVANKTGGVPGTVNDSATIFASPKNTVTCACLSSGVKYSDRKEMRAAIAEIGFRAYQTFKK